MVGGEKKEREKQRDWERREGRIERKEKSGRAKIRHCF